MGAGKNEYETKNREEKEREIRYEKWSIEKVIRKLDGAMNICAFTITTRQRCHLWMKNDSKW